MIVQFHLFINLWALLAYFYSILVFCDIFCRCREAVLAHHEETTRQLRSQLEQETEEEKQKLSTELDEKLAKIK